MSLDIRSHWAQVPNVHLRIAAVVLLGAGTTNLILGVFGAVLALAVFVLSLYLLGVLIWMWERRDDTSDLSLLKLGP
jgi:hypothetical protein